MTLNGGRDAAGLSADDFRLINRSGFGDGLNSYAHAMAWFEGRLYIGTTRGVMQMNAINVPVPNMKPWPTDWSPDIYNYDRRAQIWCYDPEAADGAGSWTLVYRADHVKGRNGRSDVPRYIAFRAMTVFQSDSDSKPCLYAASWAPAMSPHPPAILRSENGTDWKEVAALPFGPAVRSFRTLQPYNGWLHSSPTTASQVIGGVRRAQDSVSSDSTLYCTRDPIAGDWIAAGPAGFGDPTNLTVFELEVFENRLYAGCINPQGLQLWRTEENDTPPYRWKKVMERGAWRGPHNEGATAMCAFKGALYLGTGVANGGFHRQFRIGPAAAEVLRIWPDDSWELLVGLPRHTPDGVRTPLSGYGEGFDNLFNGYIWRMCAHDGWLYAGTFCWANVLPYVPMHTWPEDVLVLVRRWGLDRLNREMGGFDLWRTADGVRWFCVTRSGFGNQYNWGVRNLTSTPYGLFLGSANPYGPQVAIQRRGKWQYAHNPRGGCEVFLGRKWDDGA